MGNWSATGAGGAGLSVDVSRAKSPSAIWQAGDGDRTRYLNLGKVALCQMSYSRATSILFESYVSTTPSAWGAISVVADLTRAEYSSTSAADFTGSRVDAMMWYSGLSASGTTSTHPPSTNTLTPSVRSTLSLMCFSIIVRITRPFTSQGQNSTAVRCATAGILCCRLSSEAPLWASSSSSRTV